MTPLPDVFAVYCFDGDRWVAVWSSRTPYGRGFDRRELRAVDLLPGDRLHGGDEGNKPAVQVNGDLPRRPLRAIRAAQ